MQKHTRKLISNMISELNTIPMSGLDDSVGEPLEEYQWDIWNGIGPSRGDRVCYNFMMHEYIRPIVYDIVGWDPLQESGLSWVFVRKYEKTGRQQLDAHFDTTVFTLNIVLSEPSDYEGGEFIFAKSQYFRDDWNDGTTNLNTLSENLLERGMALKLKPNFGEIILLRGNNNTKNAPNLHRVFPVTNGTRYVLCLFFENNIEDIPKKIMKYYNKYNS